MSKYKVGDKVKIVSEKTGERWNNDGKMDKWLGKVMTIKAVEENYYRMEEDKYDEYGGWFWYNEMIECKVEDKIMNVKELLKEIKNNKIVVNCTTREQASEFVKMCYENGIYWRSDDEGIRKYEIYYTYGEDTCYECNYEREYGRDTLSYADIDFYKEEYTIISFDEFMKRAKGSDKAKSTLNKGIDGALVQDTYRAVQKQNGNITFNKVKMVNLCFVKHDGSDKVYMFNNPTDKRLETGTRVLVDTVRGEHEATVVSSIKIQQKYINGLSLVMGSNPSSKLKDVLGIVETVEETITKSSVTRFEV